MLSLKNKNGLVIGIAYGRAQAFRAIGMHVFS